MKTTIGIIGTLGTFGIASLALLGLSTPARAQDGLCDVRADSCLAALRLSRPQARQVESYHATAVWQSRQVQAQIDRVQDELRFLARLHRPTPNAIARKQAELQALHSRERGIWLTYRVQVEALLYPAQRATWAHCSHRGPALAVVRPVAPVWQAAPKPVVVVQTRGPRPMGRR